jgi:D-alanine--poly(phosphoribitol) ligase subunit 2
LRRHVSTAEKTLAVLADVTEIDEVRLDPDIRLYDLHILDSLATVQLMVAFSEEFGLEISPAEFEPEQWATPRNIVTYMIGRVGP